MSVADEPVSTVRSSLQAAINRNDDKNTADLVMAPRVESRAAASIAKGPSSYSENLSMNRVEMSPRMN